MSRAVFWLLTTRNDQLRKAMAMNVAGEGGTNDSIDSVNPRGATGEFLPQRTVDWGRSVAAFIGEHPELCLVLALALGAVVGVVVKRR